jgi:hypothetical protein
LAFVNENSGRELLKVKILSSLSKRSLQTRSLSPTSQSCAEKLRNASPDITVVISPTDMHKKLFHALKTLKYSVPAAQATATPKIAKSSSNCNNITGNFKTVMHAWS